MKKVLAFVLALVVVMSAAVSFTACDNNGENKPTSVDDDGKTLGGKTPEEVYRAAQESVKTMKNYELVVNESYSTSFIGEEIKSVMTTEYNLSDNSAYIKNSEDGKVYQEQWFVDNALYHSSANNKEKVEMDFATYLKSYSLNTESILLELPSAEFSDKVFEQKDGVYFLNFEFTPEKFYEYVGGEVNNIAVFNVGFNSDGSLRSVYLKADVSSPSGSVITMETGFELKSVGKTAEVTAPENTEDYRVAPSMSSLDMTNIDTLDSVIVSEEETDYVMIDVENYGKIVVRLYDEVAPKTVANFKKLVKEGFYDGLIFHRIIEGFMIQSGGFNASMEQKECDSISGEFASNGFSNNLKHLRGVISMARTNEPNSASSQFFIMHAASEHLDGSYAAFGYTVYGLDVVDAIATVETDESDCPTTPIVITSIKFVTLN